MEFRKKISYSMKNGKKITKVKRFRNLYHFDNYFNKLVKAGCNIIDLQNI